MHDVGGIIFDKDGTLFDFNATWTAWAVTFLTELACGDPARAQVLGGAIGFDTEARAFAPDSPAIAGTPHEVAECLLPHVPGATPAALIMRMNVAAAEAPMQEAVPLAALLDRLAGQGLRLGVVTNDAEGPARAHLGATGITDRFDFIAGCDSGYGAKPAPGPLLACAAYMGLPPAQVLMVGDSRHDLAAGHAAGMRTVGVLTGLATEAELRPYADLVLPDIGHLPEHLFAMAA
ncbi:HAD family hydrolase [Actibacterium sp. XHP0104]|uniref:HAD family hydrolase n=1 Tax=Actibacterium sp. XHP0104 TaxID=2984335 RepID=UPI0021E85856|nr:HAD family hydrolase [Actibacterium sp. XHP0104]MCV2881398.1 HAD family hydrolase [Actibacterium sp. XHP0104]